MAGVFNMSNIDPASITRGLRQDQTNRVSANRSSEEARLKKVRDFAKQKNLAQNARQAEKFKAHQAAQGAFQSSTGGPLPTIASLITPGGHGGAIKGRAPVTTDFNRSQIPGSESIAASDEISQLIGDTKARLESRDFSADPFISGLQQRGDKAAEAAALRTQAGQQGLGLGRSTFATGQGEAARQRAASPFEAASQDAAFKLEQFDKQALQSLLALQSSNKLSRDQLDIAKEQLVIQKDALKRQLEEDRKAREDSGLFNFLNLGAGLLTGGAGGTAFGALTDFLKPKTAQSNVDNFSQFTTRPNL